MIKVKESDTDTSIELTPMIDMVFLLLIFFLVATTFQQTEREMKIALPMASSAGPISSALRELIVRDRRAVRRFLKEHHTVLAARVRREVRNKLRTGRKNPRK